MWQRRGRGGRRALLIGRVLVALLSVVVLSGTGVGWAMLHGPGGGLTSSDVIGSGFSAPDGAMDVLLVGNDSRTDAQGNPLPEEVLKQLRTTDDEGGDLTDSMILVRIPNDGSHASAVSFPRDTLVNLDRGYGEAKLNSAYGLAKQDEAQRLKSDGVTDPKEVEKQANTAGQRFLVETIGKLSGASIDHYAEVNLLGFNDITKAVGGVDVCLKNPVDDSHFSGAVFPAGRQTVQGADALAFVRQRHGLPRNDLDRVVRQQVFMSGLVKKMLDSGTLSNPGKLSELYGAVKKTVVLDEGWDLMGFAEQMSGIAGGNVEFSTIPVDLEGPSGEEDVVADEQEVHQYVKNLLLAPQERKAKQQQQAALSKERAATTVNVYNASEVNQLAGRVLENLTSKGFTTGASANSESMSTSVVYHAPGDQAAAQQVADLLGGLPTEPKQNLDSETVSVYLGSDYNGPGARNFAGNKTIQLDGGAHTAPQPMRQQQNGDQPITADGVPCVN